MAAAASSSSSSPPNTNEVLDPEIFDVFISFRGEDTRYNFTSLVHSALERKQIKAFIDSKDLRSGDEIAGALLEAIEGSKLYLVIFSPKYASSTWCLRELEKILQCRKQHKKQVIPVFHKVDPTHIRHQTGSFGEGFTKVKARAKEEQVQRWKDALEEAAGLSGRHLDEHKPESEFIEELAEFVCNEMDRMPSSSHDNSNFLVGIDPLVKKVILCLASPQVRSVGLWGMGGVGKTTIAEAVFGCIRTQFQSSHFFRNVREELNRFGATAFWDNVLSEILGMEKNSRNLSLSDFVWKRLARKKVFIVFDDVESSGFLKLEGLSRHHKLFGAGSKILVTSRDNQVLKNLKVDEKCEVVGLEMDDALKLFSKQAFHNECPADGFMELSRGVVDYAQGNPLALKVLGSALIDQDKEYWESKLNEMKSFIDKDIFDVLRVSFDGLSGAEKEIFLDIACLFQGQDVHEVTESLKCFFSSAYYSSPHCCITNLKNKSLLKISNDKTLEVHHLLQEMSWKIEREQAKRKRLHIPVDIDYLLTKNETSLLEILSIVIDLSASASRDVWALDFVASVEMLKKMLNLRFLKVYGSNEKLAEHATHLVSNTLRYIHWEMFSQKSLPSTFHVPNLVKFSLPSSNIERLDWGQEFVNLRWLDLKNCRHLVESPDLSKARGIKYLDLTECRTLRKLHPSTQHLTKLEVLHLAWCKNLEILPDKFDSETLSVLNLLNCENIQGCPEVLGKLDRLSLYGSGITELPPCCGFKSLRELNLVDCKNVTKFPEFCTNLERLYLQNTGIYEIPSSVEFLNKLDYLYLGYNNSLSSISSNIWTLKSLKTLHLIRHQGSIPRIMEINGSGLRELHFTKWWSLPEGMCNLKSLCKLEILPCRWLQSIPELPHSLEVLDVTACEELETITISKLSNLKSVRFPNCFSLGAMACQQIMQHAYFRIHQVISLPVEVVLPGTYIPTWFHHTSEGASVTVRLPSINSNPLIGIAFCISIHSPGGIGHLRIKCICRANTKDGQNNHLTLRSIVVTRLNCSMGRSYHNKVYNHIALRYLEDRPTMESFHKVFSSKDSEATFEFRLESSRGCEVTNCGVYLKFDEKSCERSLEQEDDKVNSCLGPVPYQAVVLRADETQEWHEEHLRCILPNSNMAAAASSSLSSRANTNEVLNPENSVVLRTDETQEWHEEHLSCIFPNSNMSSAAASSSSHPNTIGVSNSEVFDVFISFRGKDTRNYFTSYVHSGLRIKQIKAFIDSEDLRSGDEISGALLEVIEGSKLYLVIFSPEYASSTWCLRELEKILQCRRQHKKQVIPVFHKVDPTHIRYQTGSFGEGFTKVKAKAKEEQVQRWKAAMKEAADLSGRHQDEHKSESEFIDELVEFVWDELYRMPSSSHDNSNFLVGIDPHVEKVISSLCLASPQVRSVGLWGMGGVGKTTIAEAVFDCIRTQFQSSHFFRNVTEELNRFGEIAFWNKVLSEILEEKSSLNLSLRHHFVRKRLARKRVFIVFDDVESSGLLKLEDLVEHHRLFGAGSKILVTSRDIQVLANLQVDERCKVVGLQMDDALKLFSKQAFHNECPADGFSELSKRVVKYAEGNPLALKVLGSVLFAQDKKYWESKLKEMESFIDKGILNVLRVCFDGLSDAEKEIFLDIACLFQGQDVHEVTELLECFFSSPYYSFPRCCIINLSNKSLLMISSDKTLEVHDLLQEMSWKIEREQSKRKRLHIPVDIDYLLANNKAAKEIQSIIIDLSAAKDVFAIDFAASVEMLKKMVNLRVLKAYGRNEMFPKHALHLVPNTLRYVHWEMFQKKSLPPTFDVLALVKLTLSNSNIERLRWRQELVNLEIILDKLETETLNLLNCENIQGCPEVLGKLDRWSFYGSGITELPPCCGFKSLRELNLVDCSNVTQFPDFCTNLERLYLVHTGIYEIPSSVEFLNKLDYLYLGYNNSLSSISSNIWTLKSLKTLHLIRHQGSIPRIMQVNGSGLREFHVTDSNSIMSLPEGMCNLKSLCKLEIISCRGLRSIPELPHSLEVLDVTTCPKLETITISNLSKLKSVRFRNCFRLDAMACQQIMQHAYFIIHQVSLPVEFVLPVSDIPTWFHHASEGASVTVRLPSINSNPLIGIAFCISIHSDGTIGHLRIKCICRANTKDGQNNHLTLRSIVVTRLNCRYVPDGNYNHIALRYLEDRPTMESIHNVFSSKYSEVTFEFHLESSNSCEVTNCGVYLKFDEKSYELGAGRPGEEETEERREEHLSVAEEEFYSCDEDS